MNSSEKADLTRALESRRDILFAYLFGSQAAGTVNPMSDIDVAVYTQNPMSGEERIRFLSELMTHLETNHMDLVDLRLAPPVLAYEIASSGQTLVIRDQDAQNRFEQQAFLHYFDTQYLRDVQDRYLRSRLRIS